MDHYLFFCVLGICVPILCAFKWIDWLFEEEEVSVEDDYNSVWRFRHELEGGNTVVTVETEIEAKPKPGFRDIFCGCAPEVQEESDSEDSQDSDFVVLNDRDFRSTSLGDLFEPLPERPGNSIVSSMTTSV